MFDRNSKQRIAELTVGNIGRLIVGGRLKSLTQGSFSENLASGSRWFERKVLHSSLIKLI